MALLGQDFIKFDYDKFNIRFTITDATTNISGYTAWWGVAPTVTGDTVVQKTSAGWTTGPTAGDSTQIEMGTSSVTVKLTQSDFGGSGLLSGTTYYHELVLSSDGTENNSVVVASGDFTVNPSLFTGKGYRP